MMYTTVYLNNWGAVVELIWALQVGNLPEASVHQRSESEGNYCRQAASRLRLYRHGLVHDVERW